MGDYVFRAVFQIWRGCLTTCFACERILEDRFEETIEHQRCIQRRQDCRCECGGRSPVASMQYQPNANKGYCAVHGAYEM